MRRPAGSQKIPQPCDEEIERQTPPEPRKIVAELVSRCPRAFALRNPGLPMLRFGERYSWPALRAQKLQGVEARPGPAMARSVRRSASSMRWS